jgi:putative tryptophan/tyrosine transport system substrate-binding protein
MCRLELLHEVVSTGTKIALMVNPNNRVVSQDDIQSVNATARPLGLEIIVVNGGSDGEIEQAFATAVQQRAAALFGGSDAFFALRRAQIAALGLRYALSTMGADRASVTAGALMSYCASPADIYRRAGTYVGRILKGEKPGDLPVQQPTKFDLVINLKTAKALGLMISRDFLLLADEVIE